MLRLLLILLLTALGCTAPESKSPNVIYILGDDLGYGDVGSYGQTKIKTPHLDRLAAEGLRFTQHYSGSPVCAPSRATLMTGRHTGHTQVRGNYELGGFLDEEEHGQMPLEEGTFTVAEMLREAGYTTAIIGKWGLGGPGTEGVPNNHGFDHFYGYLDQKQAHNYYPSHLWRNANWDTLRNGYFHPHQRLEEEPADYSAFKGPDYAPDLMTEEAIRFIRANAGRPFFLYLPYTIPHVALQVPDEELSSYEFPETPYLGENGYLPHPRPRAAYAGMISRLDGYVGRIRALVEELGLAENTLIIFSSDNGPTDAGGADMEFFDSNGPLRGGKRDVYEGGIRVPMIAWWPGSIRPGSVTDHVSANWDVMPTVVELTGARAPDDIDGVSFLPTLLGEQSRQRNHEYLHWEFHEGPGSQAVRLGDWKGVRLGGHENPDAPIEIYDLRTDVGETLDVARLHLDVVARIDSIMRAAHTSSEIEGWNFAGY